MAACPRPASGRRGRGSAASRGPYLSAPSALPSGEPGTARLGGCVLDPGRRPLALCKFVEKAAAA